VCAKHSGATLSCSAAQQYPAALARPSTLKTMPAKSLGCWTYIGAGTDSSHTTKQTQRLNLYMAERVHSVWHGMVRCFSTHINKAQATETTGQNMTAAQNFWRNVPR
jgi:hypothetical protein